MKEGRRPQLGARTEPQQGPGREGCSRGPQQETDALAACTTLTSSANTLENQEDEDYNQQAVSSEVRWWQVADLPGRLYLPPLPPNTLHTCRPPHPPPTAPHTATHLGHELAKLTQHHSTATGKDVHYVSNYKSVVA